MNTVKTGKYRHFKGTIANVLGVAIHSETKEEFVVYEHIEKETGQNTLWIRPIQMFLERVIYNGTHVQRFTYIEE